jgi:hypothetical protein
MDEHMTILPRAIHIYDGPDATRALAELRERLEAEHGRALIYELVLPGDGRPWIERCLPALADYLVAKKYGVMGGKGVRIALWSGDRVHVLDCEAFFGGVGEVLQLEPAPLELHLREMVAARRATES